MIRHEPYLSLPQLKKIRVPCLNNCFRFTPLKFNIIIVSGKYNLLKRIIEVLFLSSLRSKKIADLIWPI